MPTSRRALWRFLPLVSFAAAFTLYTITMAHVHVGDTPEILDDVRWGRWFHPSHLLPRWLVGWGMALAHDVAPTLSPYAVGVFMAGTLPGAVGVALCHQLLRRLTGSEVIPFLAAAIFGLTGCWWVQATTFELHALPIVALLAAVSVTVHATGSPHPLRMAALAGALQGLAAGLHLLATGALLAWAVILACQDRSMRMRLAAVVSFGAAAGGMVAGLYGLASLSRFTTGAYPRDGNAMSAVLLPGAYEPAAGYDANTLVRLMKSGARDAVVATHRFPGITVEGIEAASVVLVVLSLLLSLRLWRRYRGVALMPLAWVVGTVPIALRVEPQNMEYYGGPVLALVILWALAADEAIRALGERWWARLVVLGTGAAFAIFLYATNVYAMAERMLSPTGDHVSRVFNGPSSPPRLMDGWGETVTPDP